MSAKAWGVRRQEPAPASFALNLGAGGSLWRGPSRWPERVALLLGLVISALVSGALQELIHLRVSFFRGG